MEKKRIVITGGPGTGKTTLIDALKSKGFVCFPEISRQLTLEAQKEGIDQLFLTDPLFFSQKLLEGRTSQFLDAGKYYKGFIFLDRGIPDVLAYMSYVGNEIPEHFNNACLEHRYDHVFILPPWEEIYISDNERYENFDQAMAIHEHLEMTYRYFGYDFMEIPTGNIEFRVKMLLDMIKSI